ncbi:hypothetical protein NZK33_11095 [Cyanobium sp. FGCU-6]|nr:hypothetical protein [Cyanobium sp. FGCU6]
MSYDYVDLDVFLNIQVFYRSAGYLVHLNRPPRAGDLLVLLRGDPGQSLSGHRGDVHVYDYVKEHRIDWAGRMPAASRIVVVSLTPPAHREGVEWLRGYLPVVPELWQQPLASKRQSRPLHIANWKPLRDDPYQHQIVDLVRAGDLEVYGGKWDRLGVDTHGLSYLEANRRLARARCCYGLMYAYQRGTTASGRMWQAPLNGCVVFSEAGTDMAGIPGVIAVERFEPANLTQLSQQSSGPSLAHEAAEHWRQATFALGEKLGLALPSRPSRLAVLGGRWHLHHQHLTTVADRLVGRLRRFLGPRRRLQALRQRR